ncbi:helix-turn-helix domain-containing protein [Alteromonas facilis]|uniref:helix-turn-helix domain-containing protein n=1 Tax=Alteromonas facilis TaxID=2048004 RepID=UPI0013D9675E|nr:AraC family transcriptional regulator [Alteromonas facilis]
MVFALIPSLTQLYISFIPTVFFLFTPAFWLYHDATISRKPWQWHISFLKHFALVPVMLVFGTLLLMLPKSDFQQMFFSAEIVSSTWLKVLSLTFLIVVLCWSVISSGYILSIIFRTVQYRKQIRLLYADESKRNLHWISVTSALIIFTWVYGLIVLAYEDKLQGYGFSETGILVLLTGIVWTVSLFGLKQKPVFEDTLQIIDDEPDLLDKKRYERSALNEDDLKRIASKLSAAICDDEIYLDPALNLIKLSKLIGEPPQYISQTLTQHLGTTFFDFVNQARVKKAEQLLVSSDSSVLDVAHSTGFNSRSSFYKAFKQYTNVTPSQFRAANR